MDSPALARGIRLQVALERALLWLVFVLVHVWLIWLNLALSAHQVGEIERTTGDVETYRTWSLAVFERGEVVGIDSGWVYPILALVPILGALALGSTPYVFTWLVLVSLLNAVAFGALQGRAALTAGRRIASWWFIAFVALTGPVALGRVDSVTLPIAVVALILALRHPVITTALLTIAAWMKVWPAALIASLVIASRHRGWVVSVAGVISGCVVLGCLIAGAGANAFSFISSQSGRGVQIEAPVAVPWLIAVASGDTRWRVEWDEPLLTYQVVGPGASDVAAMTTWLLAVGVLAVVIAGVFAVRRGARADELLPALALAMVCVLILGNKVGSPQYVLWLAAPVAAGLLLNWRRWLAPATTMLLVAVLTQAIYPFLYTGLRQANPLVVGMLTVKYVLVALLFMWAVAAILRHRRSARDPEGSVPQVGDVLLG